MTRLADTIAACEVRRGSLAIFWLGQAGFAFKTATGQLIFIDAYLSNMCETTLAGGVMSKRMIPPPLLASEITHGVMASTHAHQDHHDEETISRVAANAPHVQFAGPISCIRSLKEHGIPGDRQHMLSAGDVRQFDGFSLRAVYADHGNLEPDGVGIVLESEGIKIYHTGDTCYCPERMREVIGLKPDVIIPCINGTFGNLNGIEAARLAADVGANVAIPAHFWFFVGQNLKAEGTPAAFLQACQKHAPRTEPVILCVSEPYLYGKR